MFAAELVCFGILRILNRRRGRVRHELPIQGGQSLYFNLFTVRTVYSLAVRSARRIWGLPGPTDFKLDSENPGPTFMPTGRRPGGGSAWQPPSQTRLPGRLSPCLAGCKARTIIMIHGSPAALRLSLARHWSVGVGGPVSESSSR